MGRLTTHVLDTARGRPAGNLSIRLYRLGDDTPLKRAVTNADGRCEQPLLEGDAMVAGVYELRFDAGTYFDGLGLSLPEPKFLEVVTIRFGISDTGAHYHVPLLLSPFGYSTYRGS
ncbi:5-hydroxyisourate hydrolase [Faunimonas pinastri]|uniref:5-hydroxyisourate hydrolase n=1 Tax=Faunimonas pinastri TaxID=1855383 RepID=A0A1H9KYR3_9HYPH|nr:hydroxyisourate hydrolase [Faunimonas pinastri]SER03903.1 5-hydroxyisourate hydrolase [Faunimonas pinastri]